MFGCVECKYKGHRFNIRVAGVREGHLVYEAICPSCGDNKVIPIGNCTEMDLTIGLRINDILQTSISYEFPGTSVINNQNN